jgi:hypothetical protein
MKPQRGSRRARSNEWSADEAGDAATVAARERVRGVLEGVTRINLGVVVVAPPDATRMAARDVARTAASVAGRGPLLRESMSAAREVVLDSFARSGFSGTWAATQMTMSVAGPTDRVAAAAAFEEAAMAAVVEDLDVDDETLDVLRSTSLELTGLGGLPMPGSLASLAAPTAGVLRGPIQVAIVAVVVLACAFIGFAVGSYAGLIIVFIGVGIVGAIAQRSSRPVF